METQTKPAKKSTEKDVQTIITERIILQLEQGIVPWRSPWMEAGVPTSLNSKRAFRGINVLLLAPLAYENNHFLTKKQLEGMGGSVKKDEKPNIVVFWGSQQPNAGEEKKPSSLKYYLVYNIAQCDGISGDVLPEISRVANPIKACEGIVANLQNAPVIRNKESGVFYDPLEDFINLPKLKTYSNPACYYSNLFHQLAHSTGHHTRLDRMGLVQMSEYGCSGFTQEELVSEIVTNYLENYAGIPCPFGPSKEYLEGWIQKLKGDRYFIFTACTLAQKAIDFILNFSDVKEEE